MNSRRTEDHLRKFAENLRGRSSYSLRQGVKEFNDISSVNDDRSDRWMRKGRLLGVLQAISNCRDIKCLHFDDISDADLLTSQEWDSFFRSLLSNLAVEELKVECTDALYSEVCTHIGTFLAGSCTLKVLEIEPPPPRPGSLRAFVPLTDVALQALSEGLARTKCLRDLKLYRVERSMVDVLTRAFDFGEQLRNESVENIYLDAAMKGVERALPLLLSRRYQKLERIWLQLTDLRQTSADQLRAVGKFLPTLQQTAVPNRKVVLYYSYPTIRHNPFLDAELSNCFVNWVEASECAPNLEIRLKMSFSASLQHRLFHRTKENARDDHKTWIVKALNRYDQLNSLHLDLDWDGFGRGGDVVKDHFLQVCEAIKSNESIESLSISLNNFESDSEVPRKSCWEHLFQCLRHKNRLKILTIEGAPLSDGVFRALMDMLQVNIYLKVIDLRATQWENDGKAVLMREALIRNRERAAYLSTLAKAKLEFHDARSGRIFLCGNPHAGKTRLRMTMMETRHRTSWVKKQLKNVPGLKRTKGVDVELLRDDDEMQVSIWDLAGQEIFRALQTLLLPTFTEGCVFVFVFSPVKDNQRDMKHDVAKAFQDELKSWLRFVASNYPISGTYVPHVFVVITHKDLVKTHIASRQWATDIVDDPDLRRRFEHALHLHGDEELYFINAMNVKEVQPLTKRILDLFADLLKLKTPRVPLLCSKLNSEVLQRPKEMVMRPVWSINDFYNFISKRSEALGRALSFNRTDEEQKKLLEAVTLCMHDAGSVFYISSCELIVVDINWLTHKFLGKLISQGHGFHVKPSPSCASPDGFVGEEVLNNILSVLRNKGNLKKVSVQKLVLEKLLTNLDLCYRAPKENGVVRYFIPTIFGPESMSQGDSTRQPPIDWGMVESSNWNHFGYRLQCEKPETTSLTSAVFPRFQIRFRNEMKLREREMSRMNYICARDLIRLDCDGYFIIVEYDSRTGDHIDVLVRYSKRKSREKAIAFVKENILERFRKFCASPDGCRGVTLIPAIIRPECVKRLTPHKLRDNQVVLVEDLKARLRENVEKNLHIGKFSLSEGTVEGDHLLDTEHNWPEVLEAKLDKKPEPAVELLEKKDLEEILKTVQERQSQTLNTLLEVSGELDRTLSESSNSGEETHSRARNQRLPARVLHDPSLSALTDGEMRLVRDIMSRISREFDCLHRQLEEVHSSLTQQLQDIRRELGNVLRLQRETRSSFLSIMSKIDNMMGYSEALEKARIPRRPFLTFKDVGYRQKFSAVFQFGTPVRLHLMCESRLEPHVVDDQPGMKLLITDENKEWLRLISVYSVKTFWFLLKAGAQVTVGAGQVIQELSELSLLPKGGLVITDMALDELKKLDSLPTKEGGGMTEETWIFLRNRLPSDLKLADDFKLHLVRYNAGTVAANESYAWLCEECIHRENEVLRLV